LERGKVTNFTPPALAGLFLKNCYMEEGKRQKQVGGLIQEEINTIFQRLGLSFVDGGMVSISSVKVTPDLLEARIYFSVFNAKDKNLVLKKIEDRAWEVKKELAARIKHQLRRIPELKFFLDDTLDQVFKMEELFKQIKKDEEAEGDKEQEAKGKEE
jgi:ribosome-binding factor A